LDSKLIHNYNTSTLSPKTAPKALELAFNMAAYQESCSSLTLGDQISPQEVNHLEPVSWVIIRDPLKRFLSAYLDKGVHSTVNDPSNCIPKKYKTVEEKSTPAAFGDFAKCFFKKYGANPCDPISGPNQHFRQQVCLCGLEDPTAHFHYTFPVEEIDEWYPSLVRYLGIGDVVRDGWNLQGYGMDPDGGGCFYDAGDPWSCPFGTKSPYKDATKSRGLASIVTDASSKEREYYATADVQEAAIEYFAADCALNAKYCQQFAVESASLEELAESESHLMTPRTQRILFVLPLGGIIIAFTMFIASQRMKGSAARSEEPQQAMSISTPIQPSTHAAL
jgi:hypothetical protein